MRGGCSRPRLAFGNFVQPIGFILERVDIFRVGRRRLHIRRMQSWLELVGHLFDHRQLLLLEIRDQRRKRDDVRNLGDGPELGGREFGVHQRGRQHFDGVDPGVRILAQLEIGRHQFNMRAAQMHRVEVEAQPKQKRQAGGDDDAGNDDDRRRGCAP